MVFRLIAATSSPTFRKLATSPVLNFTRLKLFSIATRSSMLARESQPSMSLAVVSGPITIEISDAELQQAWEQLPEEQRVRPARVHAAQIVVATEDAGLAIAKQLRA